MEKNFISQLSKQVFTEETIGFILALAITVVAFLYFFPWLINQKFPPKDN